MGTRMLQDEEVPADAGKRNTPATPPEEEDPDEPAEIPPASQFEATRAAIAAAMEGPAEMLDEGAFLPSRIWG